MRVYYSPTILQNSTETPPKLAFVNADETRLVSRFRESTHEIEIHPVPASGRFLRRGNGDRQTNQSAHQGRGRSHHPPKHRERGHPAGREKDLVTVNSAGKWRFNFLEWEASQPEEGGGLTINIVAFLDEIAGAIAHFAGKTEGAGGDKKFSEDALPYLHSNPVDLPVFAGLPVSLPLMRLIVSTASQSLEQIADPKWREKSACWAMLDEADKATLKAGNEVRGDFEECRNYWLQNYPVLSEKTRSIITLSFSMLVRPLITRPLRKFCASHESKHTGFTLLAYEAAGGHHSATPAKL